MGDREIDLVQAGATSSSKNALDANRFDNVRCHEARERVDTVNNAEGDAAEVLTFGVVPACREVLHRMKKQVVLLIMHLAKGSARNRVRSGIK